MRNRRALLALFAVSAVVLSPAFAEAPLPGTLLVTATSLEGSLSIPDSGFGGQAGFSLEGLPLRRAAATLALGYLADRDSGGDITPTPYASLLAGWRFPASGYLSYTPLAGATVDVAAAGYGVAVTPCLTFALRASVLLSGRDYLTLTPSLVVPVGSGGKARFSLALGTRREKPWFTPIREVDPALTAKPSLFSPDGDGTDDFVVIAPGASAPKSVDRWTITAYASDGSRWRGYEGTGKLPKRIEWDGKSDDGASPDAGEDFSIVLKTYDALGRAAAADATVRVTIDVLVIREGDRYKVRVPNIHFPPDSADLSEAASREFIDENRATLERIAGLFIKFPDYDLTVEGYANAVHADDPALFAEEQEKELLPLSARRAETVKRALVLLGVDGARIETHGYGGSRPVVPGSERAGAWKNRRVEFILSR
jgi:outer membrane protein OmpA-like peptidoglycan-associated protein